MAGKNTTTRSAHRAGFYQDQRLCCSVFAHLGQLTKQVERNLTTSQRLRISGRTGDARFCCPSCLAAFSALELEPLRMQSGPELPTFTPRAWFLLWAERFAISRAPRCYDSKRTRPPCDCSIEIAFESKETNSSAPSHSPS